MSGELHVGDVGFADEATADLGTDHLARLAVTLDLVPLRAGEPLPLLWHWACFTPQARTAELGEDGHPRPSSEVLARHPRRMWGAGEVEVLEPLRAGRPATRRSRLLRVRETVGDSGELLIAQVGHEYHQDGAARVREEQTIVYRSAGPPQPLPVGDDPPVPDGASWSEALRPDARLLQRFSAVTFNTHRIHYDLPYATQVEGYPALVVHGPLSAMLLARGAARSAGRPLRAFDFRATAPMFCDLALVLSGRTEGTSGEAQVTRNDGVQAMAATYEVDT